jgi:MFS family permease
VIAAAGAFIFARAETIVGLIWGRALIGFGVSACLMAAFKAYTMWFDRERWPLINGFQMAAGGLGALAATSPVQLLLHHTDWRGLFTGLAVLSLVIGVLILVLVPKKEAQTAGSLQLQDQLRSVREIFVSREFLRIAPLTTLSQATFLAIQGLWAGPWLSHVAGLTRDAGADILFLVALAMVGGFILMGSLAAQLTSRLKISVATTAVTGMSIFMVFQLALIFLPNHGTTLIWMGFGFFGTSGILSYAALTQSFPVYLAGRVTTAINLLVFVAAFLAQWFIGWLVGILSPDPSALTATAFNAAFGVLLGCELLCLVWYLVIGGKRAGTVEPESRRA